MTFTHKLTFSKAVIKKVECRQIKGVPRGSVELRVALTHDIAISIGIAAAVYTNNGTPKANMPDKQTWDHVCGPFRAIHELDQKSLGNQRQTFEFDGTLITDAKVEKSGKKGLVLSFKLHFPGADLIVEMVDYWIYGGSGTGTLKLIPAESGQQSAETPDTQIPLPGAQAAANGKTNKAKVN